MMNLMAGSEAQGIASITPWVRCLLIGWDVAMVAFLFACLGWGIYVWRRPEKKR